MIREINGTECVLLFCQRTVQPIGELYTTVVPWEVLKKIAYTNPRILMGIDEAGKEEYAGIQRQLAPDRKKEISDYVNKDSSATFPSSIIINIPNEKLDVIQIAPTFDLNIIVDDNNDIKNFPNNYHLGLALPDTFLFVFPYVENVAQIIDGQHRMSGFDNSGSDLIFDLPVTIFVEQLVDKQAEIFATINGKQTRVSPSLVYDLFGLSQKRSPYKVANELVKLLNESELSPIKNWIRILGKANSFYAGYITQSTVIKNILLLYCGNIKQAEEDKRVLADGKKPSLIPTMTTRRPIFRQFFVDEEDDIIFKALINFFNAVKKTYPVEWELPDTVIKKTVGFSALFKIFIILASKGMAINDLKETFFIAQLEGIDVDFSNILLSSKGVNQLVDRFNIEPLN
ncbi:DGQHR domain-containing protein [Mucilaginibacter sp. UR6-1]|uniref:DGQHR domain-containing protein n=1 Tax=Mucilaginibacter sp. UR6-1 TaxID=1435643 RepID=UPI001E5E6C3B|nr:DGQHR domain-containing protein [Mucilaginibacter sp. UR6-1]MCC8407746.1 DGQHR domain-containing protein [Mucilaginibacter sp. UR6-1]